MPMFNIADFTKKSNDLRVLDGARFTVEDGEFLDLVRPDISAKTENPRAIGGIETVDSGRLVCGYAAAAD